MSNAKILVELVTPAGFHYRILKAGKGYVLQRKNDYGWATLVTSANYHAVRERLTS